jgi:hypothetical protein
MPMNFAFTLGNANHTPLAKIAKRYRRENETSDEEDNIPLMELGKCLRARQIFDQNQTKALP